MKIEPEMLAKAGDEDGIQAAYMLAVKRAVDSGQLPPHARWIFAIPNGGQRDRVSANIMRVTGTKSGVWDVCIPFPSHDGKHCLAFIEFKRLKHQSTKNGGLSDNQLEFGTAMHNQTNARLLVAYGWQQALAFTQAYLTGPSKALEP